MSKEDTDTPELTNGNPKTTRADRFGDTQPPRKVPHATPFPKKDDASNNIKE